MMKKVVLRMTNLLPLYLTLAWIMGTFLPLSAQKAVLLPEGVNSQYEEREPIPSANGRTLYFWRRETPQNTGGERDPGDIWVSSKYAGTWQDARRMPPPLNSRGQEFVWQVSPRGDTLWVMQNAPGVNDLGAGYTIKKYNGNWSRVQPINIQRLTYKGNFKDFSFNRNRIMIVPNEGLKTYGGTDLYVCLPKNDTAWMPPMNLGPVINSAADEDAGYLLADGRTLFFNSNVNGDHEVFVSYRKGYSWTDWTVPALVGPPVNTPEDDFDFILSADERTAFWCSNQEEGLGSNDMYTMDMRDCNITLYPEGDQMVCEGETLTLTPGFALGKSVRYQWLKNGSPIKGGFNRSLLIRTPGAYQLVRQTTYCVDTSAVTQVDFVPPPVPTVETGGTVLCIDDSIMLRARAAEVTAYQWQYNGLDLPGANRAFFHAKQPGTYTVKAVKGICEATSAPIQVETFDKPDIYLAKDTALGEDRVPDRWLWTNKIPDKNGKTQIRDMATSPKGDVYVLHALPRGHDLSLRVTHFSPEGLQRETFSVGNVAAPSRTHIAYHPDGWLLIADQERFLSAFSLEGKLLWTKDRSFEKVLGVAIDPLGHIIVAATYEDTTYLGPKLLPPYGRGSAFIAKYTTEGDISWAQSFPIDGLRGDVGNAISTDCLGNIYFIGKFKVIANFRKKILRGTVGSDSYFLAHFTPEGNLRWAHELVVPVARPSTADMYVDCSGNTYVTANQTIWWVDKNGNRRLNDPLALPGSAKAQRSRIGGGNQKIAVATLTNRGTFVVTELNDRNMQEVILNLNSAVIEDGFVPSVGQDLRGNIYVAAVSKDKSLPGAQFDLTSKSKGLLIKRGKPDGVFQKEPVFLCKGEFLSIMTDKIPGLAYQWFFNGAELKDETNFFLTARKPGTYQVRITSSTCDKLSGPFQVAGCEEDPMAVPTITAAPDSELPTVSPPAASKPERKPNISYGSGGKPKKIWGRKVKVQEEIAISNPEVELLLWDNKSQDNDTVSVNVNGNWVTQFYGLKKAPASFKVKLKPGDNYIILYAHNMGAIPPNTAALSVNDGKKKYQVVLASKMKSCGTLKVVVD